jgi:hypothetical protein
MSPTAPGGSTRATRATTNTAMNSKTKDENTKSDTLVKDIATAIGFLVDNDLKSDDDELTLDFLSIVAMQMSQQAKLTTKQASDGLKALSHLMRDIYDKRIVDAITGVIAKAVNDATKKAKEDIETATELLTSAAARSNNTAEELREECRNVVAEIKEAVEEAGVTWSNGEGKQEKEGQDEECGMTTGNPESYAECVKKASPVPAVHAAAVARAELQKRRIRLIKATGLGGDGLGDLTEKQWVEKANMALAMMDGQEEYRPEGTTFVGANRERENRGVVFEMNSKDAAGWLKDKKTMTAFLSKMGSTVDFKMLTFEVVVDWVPVSFEAEQPTAWRRLEQTNGFRENSIQEAAWIKPVHLRAESQRTALVTFRFATREDANRMIEHGMFVEGKKVWGRKQLQEPKRCLKCQCFGEHKAAECKSVHETCGRCSRQHKTNLCTESSKGNWECSNCKATGHTSYRGHGAADRRCPVFLARVDKMNSSRQENRYKYFCTNDPATWETYENKKHNEHQQDDVYGKEYRGEGQGRGEARGRLGGGVRGEGGGQGQGYGYRQADKGWEGMKAKAKTRTGGDGDKSNSITQTGAPGNGDKSDAGREIRGESSREDQQEAAVHRAYRREMREMMTTTQTTLPDMWGGISKDTRSWSEDIEARTRAQEQEQGSQRSTLSYV